MSSCRQSVIIAGNSWSVKEGGRSSQITCNHASEYFLPRVAARMFFTFCTTRLLSFPVPGGLEEVFLFLDSALQRWD